MEEWTKRKNALTENSYFMMLPNGAEYQNDLTDRESELEDSVTNKQDGGSGTSSEDRFEGIYSNWQSVPLDKYNVTTAEDAEILYKFLRDDQIGIENMSKNFLQQYINKIRTLLDSEGFHRYEQNHANARQTLMNKYGDISQSERAMELLEGTEEGDFIRDSLPADVANGGHADTIYTSQPHKTDTGDAGDSLDDVMNDADEFIGLGETQYADNLDEFSNTIYNILLSIGTIVAVIVGAIIGVKLMASNIDTKVEAKKLLIPYVVGCVVVFGGFAIWKIVVSILQGM